jgi:hypothetical protein
VKSRAADGKAIDRVTLAKVGAGRVRKPNLGQALAGKKVAKAMPPPTPMKFTVPEVWRSIVKKNGSCP